MTRNFELLQALGREQELTEVESIIDEQAMPEMAASEMAAAEMAATEMPTPPIAPQVHTIAEPHANLGGIELTEVTKLVQQVFLIGGASRPRMVVFTSTEPGTGCSWVAARTAEVLARHVARPVCLVDANLRRPSLHNEFKLPNTRGLADSLRVNDPMRSFAYQLAPNNLFLMTSGSSPEKAASLLGSDRMRARLSELRSWSEYVLIDASALNQGLDAAVLGAASDGVVLVLKANASRREPARRFIHELTAAKAKVLGAVLNHRTFPLPEAIYSRL